MSLAKLNNASMQGVGTKVGTRLPRIKIADRPFSRLRIVARHHPDGAIAKLATNPTSLLLPIDHSVRWLVR